MERRARRVGAAAPRYAALIPFCLALVFYAFVLSRCLTMCWLPALLAAEALRPRLHYAVRRWSTVFPGRHVRACSFVVGAVTGTPGITDFARIWV